MQWTLSNNPKYEREMRVRDYRGMIMRFHVSGQHAWLVERGDRVVKCGWSRSVERAVYDVERTVRELTQQSRRGLLCRLRRWFLREQGDRDLSQRGMGRAKAQDEEAAARQAPRQAQARDQGLSSQTRGQTEVRERGILLMTICLLTAAVFIFAIKMAHGQQRPSFDSCYYSNNPQCRELRRPPRPATHQRCWWVRRAYGGCSPEYYRRQGQ
jgi:hypothetical protein